MEIKLSIGRQINKRRKFKGLSQQDLAVLIGKTTNYVGYIERSERKPRPFDLANIEKVLNFKVEL